MNKIKRWTVRSAERFSYVLKGRTLLFMAWLSLTVACSGAFRPPVVTPPVTPKPPAVTMQAFDVVGCNLPPAANYCPGPINTVMTLTPKGVADTPRVQGGDGNGYTWVAGIPSTWFDATLRIEAPGYNPLTVDVNIPVLVATNAKGLHNMWLLTSAHVDPTNVPLRTLAAIHGAMWPQTQGDCDNFPRIGPRPGQATNIFATDFITEYTDDEQACGIAMLKRRGYMHVVVGPIVDSDGYHGVWTPNDWRGANFNRFLDALQKFWDNGLTPVVFGHPDGWSLEQTKNELTWLLQQPRAQRLIRIFVPHGWEPCKYECSSYTWAGYGSWARDVLPNALILLHTVADVDAPVGTDALGDDNGHPNAEGWQRVAPFYHGWLTQSNAFDAPDAHGDANHPANTNFQNWQDNFRCAVVYSYCNRLHNGYAGWPTGSAWGAGQPMQIYAGEYSAYWRFWRGRQEAEGVAWGDAAMAAGADGYLDGGSVAVTVH